MKVCNLLKTKDVVIILKNNCYECLRQLSVRAQGYSEGSALVSLCVGCMMCYTLYVTLLSISL